MNFLPNITDVLASSSPAAEGVYNYFKQPIYLELGITIGALVLLFILGVLGTLLWQFLGRHTMPGTFHYGKDKWYGTPYTYRDMLGRKHSGSDPL